MGLSDKLVDSPLRIGRIFTKESSPPSPGARPHHADGAGPAEQDRCGRAGMFAGLTSLPCISSVDL